MALDGVRAVGVNFRDLHPPDYSENLLLCDIVVMDKSGEEKGRPIAYQVNQDTAAAVKSADSVQNAPHHLSSDAYIHLGEVVQHQREVRRLNLEDGREVSYNYLIVITSSRRSDDDHSVYFAGLVGLIEALKMRRHHISPQSIQKTRTPRRNILAESGKTVHPSAALRSISTKLTSRPTNKSHHFQIGAGDKAMYELYM